MKTVKAKIKYYSTRNENTDASATACAIAGITTPSNSGPWGKLCPEVPI